MEEIERVLGRKQLVLNGVLQPLNNLDESNRVKKEVKKKIDELNQEIEDLKKAHIKAVKNNKIYGVKDVDFDPKAYKIITSPRIN